MTDNLRQVGAYIGKTGRDADRALKRAYPIQPRLERARDVFDSTLEFEMNFETTQNDERVLLDLFFKLPPPSRGCKSGCIHTKCEEFTFESGGNHAVTLKNPYEAGSVSVFVNGDKLDAGQVAETNPGAGEVFFQGTTGPDTIAICYIYLEDCKGDVDFPNCPALGPSFAGAILLFSDRFDRNHSVETYGGLGYWSNSGTFTPIIENNLGGKFFLAGTDIAVFEDFHANGIIFEVLLAVDFTAATAGQFSISPNEDEESIRASMTINLATKAVSVDIPYVANPIETVLTSESLQAGGGTVTQTLFTTVNLQQRLYIRYFFFGQIYQVKIWPQSEPEPSDWLQFSPPGNPTLFGQQPGTAEFDPGNSIGVVLTTSTTGSAYLEAIQVWGSQTDIFGHFNFKGHAAHNWTYHVVHHQDEPPDPHHIFIINPPDSATMSQPFVPGTSGLYVDESMPTIQLKWIWVQFDSSADNVFYSQSFQRVVSYPHDFGFSQTLRIQGEIKIDGWPDLDVPDNANDSLTVAFDRFHYDDGVPASAGDIISGTIVETVTVPTDGSWVPFVAEFAVTPAGYFQWGVHIVEDPVAIAAKLGENTGTLFIEKQTTIVTQMRWLRVDTTVIPLGGAVPFCPAGPILDRCDQITEGFIGPTFDYHTFDDSGNYSFVSASGVPWDVFTNQGARVDLNGSFVTQFRAAGITEDGSDGHDPWTSGDFVGDRSVSQSQAILSTFGPTTCGPARVSFQFKFGSVGTDFYVTSTAPEWEEDLGTHFYPNASINLGTFISIAIGDGLPSRVFLGNISTNFEILSNVAYNVVLELLAESMRVKVWRVGESEPNWLLQRPNILASSYQLLALSGIYNNYIDDNFYTEITNLQVSTIGTAF